MHAGSLRVSTYIYHEGQTYPIHAFIPIQLGLCSHLRRHWRLRRLRRTSMMMTNSTGEQISRNSKQLMYGANPHQLSGSRPTLDRVLLTTKLPKVLRRLADAIKVITEI